MDIKDGNPDWGNAAELATSASTIVEEITEESEIEETPIKSNSIPSIMVDDTKKDISVTEAQLQAVNSRFHMRSASLSYIDQPVDSSMNSREEYNSELIIVKTSNKETKTVMHRRTFSAVSAHKAGVGSGNFSPSMGAVPSPERVVHTYTSSRENLDGSMVKTMKWNESENESIVENTPSQQNCSKQLEILFADDKNEEVMRVNGEVIRTIGV